MATKPKSKPKTGNVCSTARLLLATNDLAITLDDLCSSLEKKGYSVNRNTIGSIMTDFRQSVRALAEAGKLRGMIATATLVKSDKPKKVEASKTKKAKKAKAPKVEPTEEVKTELKAEAA